MYNYWQRKVFNKVRVVVAVGLDLAGRNLLHLEFEF